MATRKTFEKKPKFKQALNPRSGTYVKISTETGLILSRKKDGKPYKNIPILEIKDDK